MKFLHTADWQIGKPFARISDPDKAARVRSERIEAILRIGDLARTEKASFVLVAGDLFDSFTAEKSTVSAACSAIGRIEIPVLAIPGNHDHGGPGCLWNQDFFKQEQKSLAPNFRMLLDREPVELDDALLLPCPLLRQHETEDPTGWIRSLDLPAHSSEKPRIVLAHGSVHGFDSSADSEDEIGAGAPNLIAIDRLPSSEIDYIALGDWHGTKEVSEQAWYSGTPEIDRFPRGAANEPGNVLLVEVERGGKPEVEVRETARLGWHVHSFEFASDEDLDRFEEEIGAKLGNRAGEDLFQLELDGSLGFGAARQVDDYLETLQARLLRLKVRNRVRIAPSEEEVAVLASRPGDPLLSRVATSLIEAASGTGEEAEIARIALRELHRAVGND